MMMRQKKTGIEKELIINIIKELASGNQKKEIERFLLESGGKVDWPAFKDFIIYHELSPFFYLALKDICSLVPRDLFEFLKNNYYCALVRCQYLWQEFLRIEMAFEQAGIIILPMKGIALLQDIYSRQPVRLMTDTDLLVKEEDILKAEPVFQDLGYKKELYGLKEGYWRKRQCHITFYKMEDEKSPFVELHWGLDFKRKGCAILPELWERIREMNVDGKKLKLLSPEDTLFSIVLHRRRFGKVLCLKNIYDLKLLLNKYGSNFDWDYCLNKSKKYRICSTLFFSLYQAKFLLDIDIPGYVWRGLNICNWKRRLIKKFIENNTFLLQRDMQNKELYLKAHFLLYDSLWESIDYIINIPHEQFAKFYDLEPYDKKTNFLYQARYFYVPLKAVLKGG